MNLEKYTYCYLNRIYKSNTVLAFELLLADTFFNERASYLVNADTLKEIVKIDTLIKDFDIVDDLLTSSTDKILSAPAGIEKLIGHLTPLNCNQGSFYDLVRIGADNDYVIIDDKVLNIFDSDYIVGSGISKFLNIKFSNTTMSAYCKFSTESELYNKMIITNKEDEIKFHPFYFGVPVVEDDSTRKMDVFSQANSIEQDFLGVKYVGKKIINEQYYEIYHAEMMQIYTKVDIYGPLINKAVSMHSKWTDAIAALKYFITVQYDTLAKENKTPEWVGGNSNYESSYGVYFTTSRKSFTKSEIRHLHDWLVTTIKEKKSFNKTIELVKEISFTKSERDILYLFLSFYTKSLDPTELLSLAFKQKSIVEKKDLLMTLYLYEIRINAFKSQLSFRDAYDDPLAPPFLKGSDEKTYTLVKTSYPF